MTTPRTTVASLATTVDTLAQTMAAILARLDAAPVATLPSKRSKHDRQSSRPTESAAIHNVTMPVSADREQAAQEWLARCAAESFRPAAFVAGYRTVRKDAPAFEIRKAWRASNAKAETLGGDTFATWRSDVTTRHNAGAAAATARG